ncbi:MAG: alkaline phosphatase family protein [Nanoarchaeota archaeon]
MTGKNKEKEVLEEGNKEMWNKRWDLKETFFSNFKNPLILDLPGFSYNLKVHEKSRKDLKRFFEAKTKEEKEKIRKEYNQDAFNHHREIKEIFLSALNRNYDFILGYFCVADVIGHLNFGNNIIMKAIYKDLDEIATIINQRERIRTIILSDHGMKPVGDFGDHSGYGFWSTNFKELSSPRITEFASLILSL